MISFLWLMSAELQTHNWFVDWLVYMQIYLNRDQNMPHFEIQFAIWRIGVWKNRRLRSCDCVDFNFLLNEGSKQVSLTRLTLPLALDVNNKQVLLYIYITIEVKQTISLGWMWGIYYSFARTYSYQYGDAKQLVVDIVKRKCECCECKVVINIPMQYIREQR